METCHSFICEVNRCRHPRTVLDEPVDVERIIHLTVVACDLAQVILDGKPVSTVDLGWVRAQLLDLRDLLTCAVGGGKDR